MLEQQSFHPAEAVGAPNELLSRSEPQLTTRRRTIGSETKVKEPKADQKLEQLCSRRADEFLGSRSSSLRHLALLANIAVRLLWTSKERLRPVEGTEGDIIRRWLDRRSFGLRTVLHQAASVLKIDRRTEALSGPEFSTLRRMDRKAAKLGITCREVLDQEERERLLQIAVAFEKANPNERYRRDKPNTSELCSIGLWIAAFSFAGEPLVLSITPVSGNTALLRYLRSVSSPIRTLRWPAQR
jgi:hypothetical protein